MLASALIVLGMTACATTEYVEVRPECTVPPQPTLPQISGEELRALPDDVYWRLERREKRLVDWALELRAIAEEACAPPSGGGE